MTKSLQELIRQLALTTPAPDTHLVGDRPDISATKLPRSMSTASDAAPHPVVPQTDGATTDPPNIGPHTARGPVPAAGTFAATARLSQGRNSAVSKAKVQSTVPNPATSTQDARSRLADLVAAANTLERLQAHLAKLLDTPLLAHVRIANFREHKLVLEADSPAWAFRIRYLAPTILQHFQVIREDTFESSLGLQFCQIDIITRPQKSASVPTQTNAPIREPSLSDRSREHLLACAHATQDPRLASILARLAQKQDDNPE